MINSSFTTLFAGLILGFALSWMFRWIRTSNRARLENHLWFFGAVHFITALVYVANGIEIEIWSTSLILLIVGVIELLAATILNQSNYDQSEGRNDDKYNYHS